MDKANIYRRKMTIRLTILTLSLHYSGPVQANWMLENAVDEYLHKIVAADNLFWLNNEVHNMRPDNFVRLYNVRYPSMTKIS